MRRSADDVLDAAWQHELHIGPNERRGGLAERIQQMLAHRLAGSRSRGTRCRGGGRR